MVATSNSAPAISALVSVQGFHPKSACDDSCLEHFADDAQIYSNAFTSTANNVRYILVSHFPRLLIAVIWLILLQWDSLCWFNNRHPMCSIWGWRSSDSIPVLQFYRLYRWSSPCWRIWQRRCSAYISVQYNVLRLWSFKPRRELLCLKVRLTALSMGMSRTAEPASSSLPLILANVRVQKAALTTTMTHLAPCTTLVVSKPTSSAAQQPSPTATTITTATISGHQTSATVITQTACW